MSIDATDTHHAPGRVRAPLSARLRGDGPVLVLGAALVTMAILLVVVQWRITFFQDTFSFILERQPWTPRFIFTPHNEHIVVIPVLITKTLLAVFGMSSNVPEQIAMGITVLAADVLLFVWLRRRIDPWLAVIAAVLFLFLGSGWQTILWPFENEFTLPIIFGLAGLLLLEREDSKGDGWACAMFVLATISGSLGTCFIAAAFVDLILRRKERGWRRAYVFAVPLVVYLAWYAGYGHEAEHHITLENILRSPEYVLEGFASSLDSLAGLSTLTAGISGNNDWGRPLVIAALGLIAYGQWRRPGFSRTFWVVAAAGVSYWLLAAFNFEAGREASSSRYVYAGAFFTLLMAAELLRGLSIGRRALWVVAALAALAIGPNLVQLHEGSEWEKEQSVFTRADIGAMEIARDTIPSTFSLGAPELVGTSSLAMIEAGRLFESVDRWGSFADSPSQIEGEPQIGRRYADLVLSAALPITSAVAPGGLAPSSPAGAKCVTLPGGGASALKQVPLQPGRTTIEVGPGASPAIGLRRFDTEEFPVPIVGATGESTLTLNVPADRATQPWYLHVEAEGTTRVCSR
jgi:hypothetical protein